MNRLTEAACLLEHGALYRRRIGLLSRSAGADPIFAGFKHGAFSLYFGDSPIYHFDLEGRWQRAFVEGRHYLKGLDATVHTVDRVREGPNLVLKRRTLEYAEARDFDERVRLLAVELKSGLDGAQLLPQEPPAGQALPLATEELRSFLEQISGWDPGAWLAHRERYKATYGPLPFLPPECQNAVILQATLAHDDGVAAGRLHASAEYARSKAEFEQHCSAVAALWGKRLLQSRIIFLAGSELMHRPAGDVTAYLDAISGCFSIRPAKDRPARSQVELDENAAQFDGVHALLDRFESVLPDVAAWREFAARGLLRMSLGVESGDPEVRAAYHKNWSDEDLRGTVAAIKSAGLGVSVLVLVGAGGLEHAEPHLLSTQRLIESLDLGSGDFLFLLNEHEIHDSESIPGGMTPLYGIAWLEQQTRLKDLLSPLKKRGIKVLPYTLDKEWT